MLGLYLVFGLSPASWPFWAIFICLLLIYSD